MSKEKKPNPLREQILEAAVKLLRESGLKKLAQPQVAKAAGIPQGHLTYYFPKRADLLLAVAEYSLRSVTALLAGQSRLTTGLKNQVLPLVSRLVTDRDRTRMLLGLVVESDENPELRVRLRENLMQIHQVVLSALSAPPGDRRAEIVSAALLGLGIQHHVMDGQRSDAETAELVKFLIDWANQSTD